MMTAKMMMTVTMMMMTVVMMLLSWEEIKKIIMLVRGGVTQVWSWFKASKDQPNPSYCWISWSSEALRIILTIAIILLTFIKSFYPGWGWRDVLPFFKASEDQLNPSYAKDTLHHSVGGPLPVGDVAFKTPLADAFLNAGIHDHFIPAGLVFDHIVSVIVFGLSLVLSMTHIIVINFIIFLQKGGGRASLWGTSTEAMPPGSHSCRWRW